MAEGARDEPDMGQLSLGTEDVLVTEVKAIASYSWLNNKKCTIVVPGRPAKWEPPTEPPVLPADTGSHYLDHNMGRFRSSPFEPAIRAILHLHPDFDFSEYDVITDRWALGRLLDLAYDQAAMPAQSTPSDSDKKQVFEFAAQLIGNTVVFIRNDTYAISKEIRTFNGYRNELGKKYLRYEGGVSKESNAHYRLTSYKLGGLRLLVRHAADGYIDTGAVRVAYGPDLTRPPRITRAGALTIRRGGSLLTPSSVLEITTINPNNMQSKRVREKRREAWISQAGFFKLMRSTDKTPPTGPKAKDGFSHRRCVFLNEDIQDLAPFEPPQNVMLRYQELIEGINQEVARLADCGHGNEYTVTYFKGNEKPTVTPASSIRALPADLCERMKQGGQRRIAARSLGF